MSSLFGSLAFVALAFLGAYAMDEEFKRRAGSVSKQCLGSVVFLWEHVWGWTAVVLYVTVVLVFFGAMISEHQYDGADRCLYITAALVLVKAATTKKVWDRHWIGAITILAVVVMFLCSTLFVGVAVDKFLRGRTQSTSTASQERTSLKVISAAEKRPAFPHKPDEITPEFRAAQIPSVRRLQNLRGMMLPEFRSHLSKRIGDLTLFDDGWNVSPQNQSCMNNDPAIDDPHGQEKAEKEQAECRNRDAKLRRRYEKEMARQFPDISELKQAAEERCPPETDFNRIDGGKVFNEPLLPGSSAHKYAYYLNGVLMHCLGGK